MRWTLIATLFLITADVGAAATCDRKTAELTGTQVMPGGMSILVTAHLTCISGER